MQEFFAFYQMGGAFNNFVSLFALGAFAVVVAHVFLPTSARAPLRLLQLADRMVALCVVAGVLGTLFNLMDLGAALAEVEAGLILQAGSRGLTIVPIPLIWSLMCAIPLWLATMVYRQRLVAA
jgi:hypothetical protein